MGHWAQTIWHKFFANDNNKRTDLNRLCGRVLAQAVSLEQGCLVSAHGEGENSDAGSSKNQSIPGGPEVTEEPPQNAKTTTVGKISSGPKVIEPPQINLISAWRMFIDRSKNNLRAGAGIIWKAQKEQFLNSASDWIFLRKKWSRVRSLHCGTLVFQQLKVL